MVNKNIIIFIVVLVVLVFAGAMVFITLKPSPQPRVTEPPLEPLPEKEEEIDISDWKTYRNEKYGFEMRYPDNLKLKEDSRPNEAARALLGERIEPPPSRTQPPIFHGVWFLEDDKAILEITVRSGFRSPTFREVLKKENVDYLCASQFGGERQRRLIKFKNTDTFSIIIDWENFQPEPLLPKFTENICLKGPTGYLIFLGMPFPRPAISDQIVSTFKFRE